MCFLNFKIQFICSKKFSLKKVSKVIKMIIQLSTVFVRVIITDNTEIHLGLLMQTMTLLLMYVNYWLDLNLIILHIRNPSNTLKNKISIAIMIGTWQGNGTI